MLRNVTTLRQGLKSIDVVEPADAEFNVAKAYYSLFSLGPEVRLSSTVGCIVDSIVLIITEHWVLGTSGLTR